jgi:hypothetical protein
MEKQKIAARKSELMARKKKKKKEADQGCLHHPKPDLNPLITENWEYTYRCTYISQKPQLRM